MKRQILIAGILTGLLMPALAMSQWSVGPSIVISVPTSDFSNVSGVGGGFGFKAVREIQSGFGLRGDFAFLSHGKEFQPVSVFGGTLPAEVRKESFRLAAGAQYSVGSESLRFYGGVLGGFYWFRTNININTIGGVFQAEGESDAALGWNFGGGLQYDFGLGPLLDLSVEYQSIYGVATEFEVRDQQGNVTEVNEKNIDANEFLIKIGVTFFLGK